MRPVSCGCSAAVLTGFSLYVENGAPKIASVAAMAHELTHIRQYMNRDEKWIGKQYGSRNKLERTGFMYYNLYKDRKGWYAVIYRNKS